MQEYDYSERNDELFEELEQLEWCLQEIEWECPDCGEGNTDSWAPTACPGCYNCGEAFDWEQVLDGNTLDTALGWEDRTKTIRAQLSLQKCPFCGQDLRVRVDYLLNEKQDADGKHRIAHIASPESLDESYQAARFQIAANLAAHSFDADAHVDLGLYGQMWVQCHTKRDHLGPVCWEK